MGKIIAVTNQKGGVGKTTTTVNLAASLGAFDKKVLILDIDPQGNSTSGYGIRKRDVEKSAYDIILGEAKAEQAIITTKYKNVSIIPSDIALAGAEIELVAFEGREKKLKEAIIHYQGQFDYILIDCPPSLGLLTLNALAAAESILIPIQCEYFALEGLSQLIATVRQVKRLYNPHIDIEGVLLTMYDARLNLTQQVVAEVKRYFPQKVFRAAIPRAVRLSEAPSFGEPVYYYDRGSRGSVAYCSLARELIENNKG